MALTKCSQCGKDISSRAKACPYCGAQNENSAVLDAPIKCPECGNEYSSELESCPICGCPSTEQEDSSTNSPQKVEITSVKFKIKATTRRYLLILLAIVILVGAYSVAAIAEKQRNERLQAEYDKSMYSARLHGAAVEILSGASKAEDACNLIKSVWYNTIFKESDPTTDKFTMDARYRFNSDFNDSIKALFADSG